MRMVMLHGDRRQSGMLGDLAAKLGGQVLGVPVDGDDLGPVLEQRAIKLEVPPVVGVGGGILQIADVLGEGGPTVLDQAEGVLDRKSVV